MSTEEQIELEEHEKYDVEEWLRMTTLEKKQTCPFRISRHQICQSWFPELEIGYCPCQVYPLDFVIKIAKQMIGEGGEENA